MKVSGFTIVRNGELYAYPFIEAIRSILPVCDEMIINVGKSDDNTLEMVRSIDDNKIKIFETEWDMNLKDGKVLSVETNKALDKCSGDWCFYIQGDEVLHEKYFDTVIESMKVNLDKTEVEGLRFRYRHFYGSYDYVQDNYRIWYIRESRIIRKNENIISWGDAMDFRHTDGSKINSKDINAEIYHYGWVTPPDKLLKKRSDFEKLYNKDEITKKNITGVHLGHLKKFNDTHPKVMHKRISESVWKFDAKLEEQLPDFIRKILIFIQPVTKRFKRRNKPI
ncbi:MAG: glycosyltransferase family 2 protein [Ignavibacteria bacterium]|nr:glycosyltransferase family 2 protein [Ignavibacteria bacterium]